MTTSNYNFKDSRTPPKDLFNTDFVEGSPMARGFDEMLELHRLPYGFITLRDAVNYYNSHAEKIDSLLPANIKKLDRVMAVKLLRETSTVAFNASCVRQLALRLRNKPISVPTYMTTGLLLTQFGFVLSDNGNLPAASCRAMARKFMHHMRLQIGLPPPVPFVKAFADSFVPEGEPLAAWDKADALSKWHDVEEALSDLLRGVLDFALDYGGEVGDFIVDNFPQEKVETMLHQQVRPSLACLAILSGLFDPGQRGRLL